MKQGSSFFRLPATDSAFGNGKSVPPADEGRHSAEPCARWYRPGKLHSTTNWPSKIAKWSLAWRCWPQLIRGILMNAADLANQIGETHAISKSAAKQIVDDVFAAIIDAAANGEELSVPGFGKFKVKDTPQREGRNPSTGQAITIAASKKLTFTAAKALKDALNAAPAGKKAKK
jgi:DNA-binding protein HU-beta